MKVFVISASIAAYKRLAKTRFGENVGCACPGKSYGSQNVVYGCYVVARAFCTGYWLFGLLGYFGLFLGDF